MWAADALDKCRCGCKSGSKRRARAWHAAAAGGSAGSSSSAGPQGSAGCRCLPTFLVLPVLEVVALLLGGVKKRSYEVARREFRAGRLGAIAAELRGSALLHRVTGKVVAARTGTSHTFRSVHARTRSPPSSTPVRCPPAALACQMVKRGQSILPQKPGLCHSSPPPPPPPPGRQPTAPPPATKAAATNTASRRAR